MISNREPKGAKAIVRAILPNATAKKRTHEVDGLFAGTYTHFVITSGKWWFWIGEGKTENEAWENALPFVLDKAKEAIGRLYESGTATE